MPWSLQESLGSCTVSCPKNYHHGLVFQTEQLSWIRGAEWNYKRSHGSGISIFLSYLHWPTGHSIFQNPPMLTKVSCTQVRVERERCGVQEVLTISRTMLTLMEGIYMSRFFFGWGSKKSMADINSGIRWWMSWSCQFFNSRFNVRHHMGARIYKNPGIHFTIPSMLKEKKYYKGLLDGICAIRSRLKGKKKFKQYPPKNFESSGSSHH